MTAKSDQSTSTSETDQTSKERSGATTSERSSATTTSERSGATTSERSGATNSMKETDAPSTGSDVLITDHGKTTISAIVVEKIAGEATREVPGIHRLGTGMTRTIGALRDRIPGQNAKAGQGVSVEVGERQAAIDLDIVIEHGFSITEVADGVRQNVIGSIELMTGLEVTEVNIDVNDVYLPGEDDDDESDESRVE